jgi:CubicO group peptidase (beta-lactamase class C family)
MKTGIYAFFYILTIYSATLFAAQSPLHKLNQNDVAAIQEIIESNVTATSPGLAVGIVRDSTIIFEEYAGLANLAHEIPFTQTTRSNIASNAKQYVALMALELAQQNKLSLQADIKTYFPLLKLSTSHNITVSNLINHSSGIRDIYELMSLQGKPWWREEGFSNKDAIALISQQDSLNFEPGSQYLYSNTNYILLTEVISQVSGQSFEKYAKAFFERLGMPHTSFVSDYMLPIKHRARPYAKWGEYKEYPNIADVHGDGNLFTTLGDQLRFEQLVHISKGKVEVNSAVIPFESIKISQYPIKDAAIDNYGYGLELSEYKGIAYAFHDGETGAFKANFLRFPSLNLSIVVMANNGQVYAKGIAQSIADILIDKAQFTVTEYSNMPDELSSKPEQNTLLGYYEREDGFVLRIIENEGQLSWKIGENRPFALTWQEGNVYALAENNAIKVAFEHDNSSAKALVLYRKTAEPSRFLKYPKITSDIQEMRNLNGVYNNQEIAVNISVKHIEDTTFLVTSGLSKRENLIEMVKPNTLKWRGFNLVFQFDEQQNPYAIKLDGSRTQNKLFVKAE